MLTKREKLRAQLMQQLGLLEMAMAEMWAAREMPADWPLLEWERPEGLNKKKKTLYIDEDVFRWFQKLGPGFHARIADVLRVYVLAAQSGELEAITDPRQLAEVGSGGLGGLKAEFRAVLSDLAKRGLLTKEALAAENDTPQWLDLDAARAEIIERLTRGEEMRNERPEGGSEEDV